MVFFNPSVTTCHLLYMANATPRNATVHGREEGQTRCRKVLTSSSVFCYAKYRGGGT